ncbi:unnamed protein product, partial [Pylaiella littoralis]
MVAVSRLLPVMVAAAAVVFTDAASAASDDDLVVIGELYSGSKRGDPGWFPITRSRSAPQPHAPDTESWSQSDTTLWTGIASFRDKRCGMTLFNLFSKAKFPDRLTAGVVQQNMESDEECLETYCRLMDEKEGRKNCPYRDNIRVLAMDALDAQGPCWGRHLQSYLLADEEFCMQVDSHMDFVDGWDVAMMEEWAETNNEYGVLSTYVQDFKHLGVNLGKRWEVAHLCEVKFHTSQQPRNEPARAVHDMLEPKMTTTWGAGYSFSKCHAERRVPYDPHLDGIFDGEEFSKMVRLWTNGYDVYTPKRGHLVHDYSHPDDATTGSWRRNKKPLGQHKDTKALANQRLWDLMEMPQSTEDGRREMQGGPWGLGDLRTLDDFIEFTGVDPRTRGHIGVSGDRCGSGVEWVPYDLDDGADYGNGGGGGDDVGEQGFTSWRRREGVDPIVAGPHWEVVKRKLEAAGVDFWWYPRKDGEQEEPEARAAPVFLGVGQNGTDPKRYGSADGGDGGDSEEGSLDDDDEADRKSSGG